MLTTHTWRYSYPAHDETQTYVKVPSQALSNALVEALDEKNENRIILNPPLPIQKKRAN